VGLQKHNTRMDAFTLCLELGLPPVHQELCAMRARLAYKLDSQRAGGMKTWLQTLWDLPPLTVQNRLTWVSQTKRWLNKSEDERYKYVRMVTEVGEDGTLWSEYDTSRKAPLRPWAQIMKSCEMRVRSNRLNSAVHQDIRAAFLGESSEGELAIADLDAPIVRPIWGTIDADWDYVEERQRMDEGVNVPPNRTRGEVIKTNLVRDVVLERLMSSQRTKGFRFYDLMNIGVSRGFLREAANRPDLSEGIRWLCLARTRGFPTVEGAWQRIKRSGRVPAFERRVCPLCKLHIGLGWEWAHLLVSCVAVKVAAARDRHLVRQIAFIGENLKNDPQGVPQAFVREMGGEDETEARRSGVAGYFGVISILLIGGLFRPLGPQPDEDWFNVYHLGFGHLRLVSPGFDTFHFVNVASFFQIVAPLFVAALGGDLQGDGSSSAGSRSESSGDGPVNQRHIWYTGGYDPQPDDGRNALGPDGEPPQPSVE